MEMWGNEPSVDKQGTSIVQVLFGGHGQIPETNLLMLLSSLSQGPATKCQSTAVKNYSANILLT